MPKISNSPHPRKRGFSRRGSMRARNFPPVPQGGRRRDPARFGKAFRASQLDQVVWRRVTREDWFCNVRGWRHA